MNVPQYSYQKKPFFLLEWYSLGFVEYSLLFLCGIVCGFFFSDVKEAFYGFIFSMLLSFIIGIIFAFYYIWVELDFSSLFTGPYEWEWAVYIAILNIFRMMFPAMVGLSLIGVVVGFFLKAALRT